MGKIFQRMWKILPPPNDTINETTLNFGAEQFDIPYVIHLYNLTGVETKREVAYLFYKRSEASEIANYLFRSTGQLHSITKELLEFKVDTDE
jgi:hypothetical protein